MTDETEVALVQKPNSKNDVIWAPRGEPVAPVDVDPYAQTLRFWAGASAAGRTTLHFFDGNLNGEGYRGILASALPEMKTMLARGSWTFQHDGAPAHSARKTNEWLADNVPAFISSGPEGDWPAKSPDLNWIENLWGILQEKVSEKEIPKTLLGLKRRLVKEWSNIPATTLKNCAESMPQRLAEVVRRNGEPLNY